MIERREVHRVDGTRNHAKDEPDGERGADVDGQHGGKTVPRRLGAEERRDDGAKTKRDVAAGDDAGDPRQLPDHALEVTEQGSAGQNAEHDEVITFESHSSLQ